MNAHTVTEAKVFSWIHNTINKNSLKNCDIGVTDRSEKRDGISGEVVFVSVTGTTNENRTETFHWIIKHGKNNALLRSTIPIKEVFANEIYVYDKIFPFFKQFQFDKNIQDGFDCVPKCYNTLILDNMEVLVLDNLKERGYELYDKKKTFNICHLKAVLKEYGKLHALSFALKEQKPEEFNKLANFSHDIFVEFMSTESAKGSLQIALNTALKVLKERNEVYLLEKLDKLITKDPIDIMLNLMAGEESQSVITHGDPWNNNFMFKYQNGDKTTPTNVAILD